MKSTFAFIALFLLLLLASTLDATRELNQDELVHETKNHLENENAFSTKFKLIPNDDDVKEIYPFEKFKLKPNFFYYPSYKSGLSDDVMEKSSFEKFDPKPNFFYYPSYKSGVSDDVKKISSFGKFDPKPNFFYYPSYKNGISDDVKKMSSFEKFDPKPNFFYYPSYKSGVSNDVKEKSSFEKFDPKPNFFYYPSYKSGISDDVKEKSSFEKFDPKPNFFYYPSYKSGVSDDVKEKSSFEKFDPKPNIFYYPSYKSGVSDDVKEKSSFEKFDPKPNFFYYPSYRSGVSDDVKEKSSSEKFDPKQNLFFYPSYRSGVSDDVKEKSSFEKFDPKENLFFYPSYKSGASDGKKEKVNAENNVLRLPSMDVDNTKKDATPLLHDDNNSSFIVFFTMNDLKLGNQWNINLPPLDLSSSSPLLSKKQAESIPFSYKQLPYLLNFFNFSADSPQGKAVEVALRNCEEESVSGETKFCATSFESMLDFVRSMLGSDTKFKSITSTHLTRSKTIVQKYTIIRQPEEINTPKMIGCHPISYPYTIFHCHSHKSTKVFKVSLAGENGDRIEAIAVCHLDTSEWSGDHQSFREIGSKPGLTDVCHFFPADHMVWIPTQFA